MIVAQYSYLLKRDAHRGSILRAFATRYTSAIHATTHLDIHV